MQSYHADILSGRWWIRKRRRHRKRRRKIIWFRWSIAWNFSLKHASACRNGEKTIFWRQKIEWTRTQSLAWKSQKNQRSLWTIECLTENILVLWRWPSKFAKSLVKHYEKFRKKLWRWTHLWINFNFYKLKPYQSVEQLFIKKFTGN